MTKEEMEELKGFAASMGLYDDKNPSRRAVILGKAIEALDQEPKTETVDSSTESTTESTTESSTVYVVTQDGYLNSYGSEIYLVGVFTDKKKAEKAASAERAMITKIPLNKKFPLKKDTWGGVGNDYYLGGYFE